jgi:hypothetical protein
MPMQIDSRYYPHPVLSPFSDDLVGSAFQCAIIAEKEGREFVFKITSRVSSRKLEELISEKKAVYAVHVECPATRYRKIWRFFEAVNDVRIPIEMLEGRVQVCSFILANNELPEYVNEDFHSDYGSESFAVKAGDILAVDENKAYTVDPREDPLRNIPSVFTIAPNTIADPPAIDIDTTGQKIVLKLCPENYEKYLQMRQDVGLRPILNSMIIMPALAYVLEQINPEKISPEEASELDNQRWYRVVRKKLAEQGVRLDNGKGFTDSSLSLASKLVGAPLTEGLNELEKLAENEA